MSVFVGAIGAEHGEGPAGALLPPAQPALLTMTRDGIIRIWVEVKMPPQSRLVDGTTSPNGALAWIAAVTFIFCRPPSSSRL